MRTGSPDSPTAILLVDNGSLEPAATLGLRRIASELSSALGRRVEPVSLLHSSAVAPGLLGGCPAEILEPALAVRAAAGITSFLIVPLFFGPSGALTRYVPERIAALRSKYPGLEMRIAPSLVDDRPESAECVAGMLEDRVRARMTEFEERPAVVVVDHGSPVRAVVAVRDRVAAGLQLRLAGSVRGVMAASMERRPGLEYEFGEPLIERAFDRAGFDVGTVVVAMLFISPGRHGGPGGDVAQICAAAENRHPQLKTAMTELIGTHPSLIPLLAERVRDGLAAKPL